MNKRYLEHWYLTRVQDDAISIHGFIKGEFVMVTTLIGKIDYKDDCLSVRDGDEITVCRFADIDYSKVVTTAQLVPKDILIRINEYIARN